MAVNHSLERSKMDKVIESLKRLKSFGEKAISDHPEDIDFWGGYTAGIKAALNVVIDAADKEAAKSEA